MYQCSVLRQPNYNINLLCAWTCTYFVHIHVHAVYAQTSIRMHTLVYYKAQRYIYSLKYTTQHTVARAYKPQPHLLRVAAELVALFDCKAAVPASIS